jgi:peroxiredoxin
LRRWEELRPELDARGVQIVTLCVDSPAQIRAGRAKHGAKAIMLADESLAVTDLYNLRNPTNIAPGKDGGVPRLRALPIPTTILVDARGIVRWIDQSTDYQVRSDPERVRAALDAAFARA